MVSSSLHEVAEGRFCLGVYVDGDLVYCNWNILGSKAGAKRLQARITYRIKRKGPGNPVFKEAGWTYV